MSITSTNYRPKIGETIFVSLLNQQPFLITVTGYHHDNRFRSEQFNYSLKGGRADSSSLDDAVFYPGVPIDTQFIYVVVLDEHEYMERSIEYELGYFFDPHSAFAYIADIEAGTVKPRYTVSAEFSAHSVRVEKL